MALKKAETKDTATEGAPLPQEKKKPVKVDETDHAANELAVADANAADPEPGPTHLKVVNLRKVEFYQPSTGLRIKAGEEKYLENDGWLDNQINARLLAVVED